MIVKIHAARRFETIFLPLFIDGCRTKHFRSRKKRYLFCIYYMYFVFVFDVLTLEIKFSLLLAVNFFFV